MLEQEQIVAADDMAWEAAVDQLATQVMVGGIDAGTIAALRSLGEQAAQTGFPECASLAFTFAASLEDPSTENPEALLKDWFTQLRAARERKAYDASEKAIAAYASLGDDAELVADFLVEAREHLSQIESQMLALERDPGSIDVVHAVFRAFHTIKGLAGFLGFAIVQAVSHEVETLLDLARNEKLTVDSSIVDVVLESGDFLLNEMVSIDRVLSGGTALAAADHRPLIERIRRLAVPHSALEVPAVFTPPLKMLTAVPAEVDEMALLISETQAKPSKPANRAAKATGKKQKSSRDLEPSVAPDVMARHASIAATEVVQIVVEASTLETSSSESVPTQADPSQAPPRNAGAVNASQATEWNAVLMQVTAKPASPAPVAAAQPARRSANPASSEPPPGTQGMRVAEPAKAPDAGSVRVETAKLDHLMDMVGEIVIAQSLIRHSPALAGATDTRLVGDLSQLARVTAEVQRATMSMRMVPVGQLFQKIERVIRDLSRKAGKQVVLETSGTDTEVDKTVAEELSDPLLHMVRNSVDHGIEPADERIAAGKDSAARIRLAAYHQGGQVVIEIADDGRGLHAGKIRAKAEQKGLVAATAQLSETEVYQLIFEPGFSTAEKITDVSGRGVGMDVVRRNVEKLRGRIETQSNLGRGTTFLLKLPLTLAIIDGLVVEVGCHRYIIPLAVVREIFRPLDSTLFTVEGKDEMVLVREQLLPIVRLNQRFQIDGRAHLPSDGLLVIIESENKLFCLLVDDLVGKQEVVIKGLGEIFAGVSGISGCAVLGDGQVGLILDTDGIYRGRRR